jgi:alkaline phosphatase D
MTPSRRAFLGRAGILACDALASPCTRVLAQPRFTSTPFTLGIASGYPHTSGMTLWTRIAPRDPLAIAQSAIEVTWEVASDDGFRRIAARGRALAAPEWAHSIHAGVTGLEPGRVYWYRFRAGGATSPVGRTRTAPAPGANESRMRFAFAACQQYEQGYYVAYRHMAGEDLDLVVHLGDYIYESSWGRNHVRSHASGEPYTLADYRARYALYKSDDDLQAAHAAFPWLVTWDDHEVDNDYANDRSQDLDPPEVFLARRAAAYQAYYEHMPLPAWARPSGANMQLYAALGYGRLASFFVLDGRQYKSHQVCPRPGRGGSSVTRDEECAARLDPALTFLGSRQEAWLYERLGASSARWNVIAQQTLMAQTDRLAGDAVAYWTDGWDGYPRARERLLTALSASGRSNPIVLSGDVHMSAVTDLKVNFADTKAPVVATEFVCPSISSQGPSGARTQQFMQENPHIRFADGTRRGYCTMELTPKRCVSRIRVVGSVAARDSPSRDLAIHTVESGRPGAERVDQSAS